MNKVRNKFQKKNIFKIFKKIKYGKLYTGGHSTFRGYVPIGNPGDTVILTSPLYDFVFWKHLILSHL